MLGAEPPDLILDLVPDAACLVQFLFVLAAELRFDVDLHTARRMCLCQAKEPPDAVSWWLPITL